MQTNQLCLTLIDLNAHYDPIPIKKPQMISRRINDSGIIATCHYGDEYETEYSESIKTHTTTSIDSGNQNRPTYHMMNRSIVIRMNGRMTTTTPLLTLTPDKICIQTSMMKTMRRNELLSTKPSLIRNLTSYTIPLGKGMHHRSTGRASHRSTG